MSPLEEAWADVASMIEEYGLVALLTRHGLTDGDLAWMLAWAEDNVEKAATFGHAVLLGLALGEMRTEETA